MWIACRLMLLLAGVVAVNVHLTLHQDEFAEPMSLVLEGFGNSDTANTRLFVIHSGKEQPQLIESDLPGVWRIPGRCVSTVAIHFAKSPTALSGIVHVTIGDASFRVSLHELVADGTTYSLPDSVIVRQPSTIALCRNWPGTSAFLAHVGQRAAPGLIVVMVLAMAVWLGAFYFGDYWPQVFGLEQANQADPATEHVHAWDWIGWITLISGLIALQCIEPYYFTQDDALVGELPGIILGCRSLWEGTFPDWNPYVFLGAPLATIGFWAITYPPQLISYAIARHVLDNELATMEVFAILHLIVGFIAMRYLSRRVGMSGMSANVAALSFVFAGCILIMGRSWHAFIANAVWLPLLGIAIQRMREGPVGWSWVIGVGVVLGMSYHAGFPQIVAILGLFFVVGVASVVIGDGLSWQRWMPAIPAVLLGVGIAAPLLLHHLEMMGGHERFVPEEFGIYDQLAGAALPYPLAQAELPTRWGTEHADKMGHFYFFGGVFGILFALQAVAFWLTMPDRSAWAQAWWIPCGVLSLLLVLGEPAGLWQGLSQLPMSKFFLRYSFRFFPWLAFCAILSGGLMIDRTLVAFGAQNRQADAETQPVAHSSWWSWAAGALILVLLAYHVAMCRPSFYSYGFRPYPDLPTEFTAVFHSSGDPGVIGAANSTRVASWHPLRSTSPDFYRALPLNLPHYYRVPGIFGYDPVVEGQPRMAEVYRRLAETPIEACRAYGVGWHLFDATRGDRKMERTFPCEPAFHVLEKTPMRTLARAGATTLKELDGVDPLAFANGRTLPMRLHGRGADVDVSNLQSGTQVTINFLWYPHMRLELDGVALGVGKDYWQRITTTLPCAGSTLSLRYTPPWGKTCGIGAGLCVVAMFLAWGAFRLAAFSDANAS